LSVDWGYEKQNGPKKWCKLGYGTCCASSNRQSPIDINQRNVKEDKKNSRLKLSGYDKLKGNFKLTNDKYSVRLNVNINSAAPTVSGGDLQQGYKFDSLHIHWGPTDREGSEHTINGRSYSAELHLVHMSLNAVVDPIAVIGVFLKVQSHDNPHLEPIINALKSVKVPGSSTDVPAFNLLNLLPNNKDCFYRYQGSLTTPPCSEQVVWTVLDETIGVSHRQLEEFRHLQYTTPSGGLAHLTSNYRPPQRINRRKVSRIGCSRQFADTYSLHGSDDSNASNSMDTR
jgi:carbonic anhydrase